MATLTFFIVVLLAISAFYYILNFQRITYSRSETEAGWVEGYKYENLKSNNDLLILEKNCAFSFDGIDDRVSISSTPSSTVTELTVEAKVYIHSFNKSDVGSSTLAPADRIAVNHPGVDLDKLKPTWEFDKYFLIPGRIVWYKNIRMGIDAFKLFEKENGNKNGFRLIISGMVDNKSKDCFDDLKEQCKGWNNIEFIRDPSDEKLFELYKKCYAVVFTSLNEDWGIVPLEAMAFGKPVISTNRGGPVESIVDGKTGFLVEATEEDICKHMKILAEDRQMTIVMGKNSREHVAKFSIDSFIDKIDGLFSKL